MTAGEFEIALWDIAMDPETYLSGKRRAKTLKPHYVVKQDVSQLHRRFRNYLSLHVL